MVGSYHITPYPLPKWAVLSKLVGQSRGTPLTEYCAEPALIESPSRAFPSVDSWVRGLREVVPLPSRRAPERVDADVSAPNPRRCACVHSLAPIARTIGSYHCDSAWSPANVPIVPAARAEARIEVNPARVPRAGLSLQDRAGAVSEHLPSAGLSLAAALSRRSPYPLTLSNQATASRRG